MILDLLPINLALDKTFSTSSVTKSLPFPFLSLHTAVKDIFYLTSAHLTLRPLAYALNEDLIKLSLPTVGAGKTPYWEPFNSIISEQSSKTVHRHRAIMQSCNEDIFEYTERNLVPTECHNSYYLQWSKDLTYCLHVLQHSIAPNNGDFNYLGV